MAIQQQLQIILNAQNNTANAFNSLNKSLNDLKDTAIKIGTALAAALAIKDIVNTTEQWGMAVRGIQAETGLAAEQASRLVFVAQALGIGSDELTTALGRLDKQMFSTSVEADKGKDVFTKWGIAIEDVKGNTKNVAEVLSLTADRVKQLGDGAAARALEMDLFGRSGGRLHDLLMEGAAGVKKLSDESDALGLTLDGGGLKAIREFSVQTRTLGLAMEGLKVQMGILLLPILNFVVSALTRLAQWINTNVIHSREFAGVLKVVGEVLQRVFGLFKELAGAVQRFVGEISSKGLLGALKDLAGDIGKAVLQFLADMGSKFDDITGRGTPLNTILKGVLVSIGLLVASEVGVGLLTKAFELLNLAVRALPFVGLGLALVEIKDVLDKLPSALEQVNFVFKLIGVAALGFAAALGAIPLAIVGIGIGLGLLATAVIENWGKITAVIGGAFSALGSGVRAVFDGIVSWFHQTIYDMTVQLDILIGKINAVGLIHITPVGGGGTGGGGSGGALPGGGSGPGSRPPAMPSCPSGTTAVKWADGSWTCEPSGGGGGGGVGRLMAQGGIVTRPTRAIIGESGPEAVIPLGRGGMGGGNNYITVNVSGNIGMNEMELADLVGDRMISKLASFRNFSF